MKRKAIAGLLFAALSGVLVFVVPRLASADEAYYVATNGSAANSGTKESPFSNINQFMAIAKPGDTVYVRGGTYSMGETYLSKSGTADKPITIRNAPGEIPHLDGGGTAGVAFYNAEASQGVGAGSHIVIQGFVITNYWRSGINIGCCFAAGIADHEAVSDVVVRDNVVDSMGQNGITFMHASGITVQNNLVLRTGWDLGTGSWSSNINMYGMYGDKNLVSGNVVLQAVDLSSYHTDGNGIIVDLTYNNGSVRIENNVAFENGGAGIIMTHSKPGAVVNNTTYENGKEPTYVNGSVGIGYYGPEAVTGAVLRNNIAYQSSGKGGLYTSEPLTSSTVSNNNLTGDPGFVDPENADFRLKAGAPGIDAGSADGSTAGLVFDNKALMKSSANQKVSWFRWAPDFDYINSVGEVAKLFGSTARPQGAASDQGAFESGSGTGTPTATATAEPTTPASVPGSADPTASATISADPTLSAPPTDVPSGTPTDVPSGTPTGVPTGTPAPTGTPTTGDTTLYTDSLGAGWRSAGWGGSTNLASRSPAYGNRGKAILFRPAAGWAAMALRHAAGPVSTAGLSKITFKVYGARPGTRSLQVMVSSGVDGSSPWGTRVPVKAAPGKWTDVTVDLASLGAPDQIGMVAVQVATDKAQPAFSVDEIRLQ